MSAEQDKFKPIVVNPEGVKRAIAQDKRKKLLEEFSPKDQDIIRTRLGFMNSAVTFFGGCNYSVDIASRPAVDHDKKTVGLRPDDISGKPFEYLEFKASIIGANIRISSPEVANEIFHEEQQDQPGFSFLINTINYLRASKFLTNEYAYFDPHKSEHVRTSSIEDFLYEKFVAEQSQKTYGFVPRFIQAGFGYISRSDREMVPDIGHRTGEELPPEVKKHIKKAWPSVSISARIHPSRDESANKTANRLYAKKSLTLVRDRVWPLFSTLIQADMEDMTLHSFMDQIQKARLDGEGNMGQLRGLQDKLTEEQKEQLKEHMDKTQEQISSGKSKTPDITSLPDDLAKQIKKHIASLPQEQQDELTTKAEKKIDELSRFANFRLGGTPPPDKTEKKASNDANQSAKKKKPKPNKTGIKATESGKSPDGKDKIRGTAKQASPAQQPPQSDKAPEETDKSNEGESGKPSGSTDKPPRKIIYEKTGEDPETEYIIRPPYSDIDNYRKIRSDPEVSRQIQKLKQEAIRILIEKQRRKMRRNLYIGNELDLEKRISEIQDGIPSIESRAWRELTLPKDKDAAMTLLIDLSGSMSGDKIDNAVMGMAVVAEALSIIPVKLEILGFNRKLFVYKSFSETMSDTVRGYIGGIKKLVDLDKNVEHNDDGWAILNASDRLAFQPEKMKALTIFSDGAPLESPDHPKSEYELGSIIAKIMSERPDQKIIGMGMGANTRFILQYYPYCLADIEISDITKSFSVIVTRIIANDPLLMYTIAR